MEAQAVRVSLQLKPDLRIVLYDGAKEWYKSVIRFETQDICASEEYLRRSSDIRKKHEKFLRKFSGEKSLRATVLLVLLDAVDGDTMALERVLAHELKGLPSSTSRFDGDFTHAVQSLWSNMVSEGTSRPFPAHRPLRHPAPRPARRRPARPTATLPKRPQARAPSLTLRRPLSQLEQRAEPRLRPPPPRSKRQPPVSDPCAALPLAPPAAAPRGRRRRSPSAPKRAHPR